MEAKTKKMILAGSLIGALAIVVMVVLSRSKRRKLEKQILGQSLDVILPSQETTSAVIFPLKRGAGTTIAEKNAVKLIQRYINAKVFAQSYLQITQLKEDGIFGPLTEAALVKLTGLKEVPYSLFKTMQSYLYGAADLISPSAEPYKPKTDYLSPDAPSYSPSVQKNNILFGTNILA